MQIRFFIAVLQQTTRARPMTTLLSLAVGGSMQSQTEAKLASMNLKSPGLKSNMPSSPSAPHFQYQRPKPPVPRIQLELFFLIPRFRQFRRNLKRHHGDSFPNNMPNSKQPATPLILYRLRLCLERRRARCMSWRQFTWPGRTVAECDNSPILYIRRD